MFEDDNDMILPDDYQEDLPESEEITDTQEPVDQVEDTTPTEPTEPVQETPELFKLQYNKEEMEIPLEEARALAQKGMNYEKAVERAKQEGIDAYIASQGFEWNGVPITTKTEYDQAIREQQWLQQIEEKYQNQEVPEEIVHELLESRRFREEAKAEREAKVAKEQKDAEYMDFFSTYRELVGKDFVTGQDTIPQEVWLASEAGKPLKYAFMEHHMKELQSKVQVLQQNQTNQQKAPVRSVSAHGGDSAESEDDFLAGFNSI